VQGVRVNLTKKPGLTNLAEFTIETRDSPPVSQRPYCTPTHFRESIDTEIDWLVEKGYIRRSVSAWASPIVCVQKPDGSARLCVDYKKLNSVTQPQPFYMPRVEEVLESVGRARVISKMDLAKGYYQVKVRDCDVGKTAFVCHRGHFEFTRMPFRVMNTPAIFQELMQQVFRDDAGFCTSYMDDLVVFSGSWEDHIAHIRTVLGNPGDGSWEPQTRANVDGVARPWSFWAIRWVMIGCLCLHTGQRH